MPFAPASKNCCCFQVSPNPQNLIPMALDTSWKATVWLRPRAGAPSLFILHCPTEDYFMPPPKRSLCYCESCRKLRGDEAHRRRGEPPREYALPFGWCRFNLRYIWATGMDFPLCFFPGKEKVTGLPVGDSLEELVTFGLSVCPVLPG